MINLFSSEYLYESIELIERQQFMPVTESQSGSSVSYKLSADVPSIL